MPDKDYSATPALADMLEPGDGLWIAWPKKASKIETDLDLGVVQRIREVLSRRVEVDLRQP